MQKSRLFTFLGCGLVATVVMILIILPVNAVTWTRLNTGITNDFNDISCVDDRICYVAGGAAFIGGEAVILKTIDGGETWIRQSISTTNPLKGISCPTPLVCYAVGDNGTVVKTVNGGTDWVRQGVPNMEYLPANPTPWFSDVWAVSENVAVAVGGSGAIYRTVNGGSWVVVNPPSASLSSVTLSGVFFVDSNVGWLVGSAGTVYKSDDAGASWTRQNSGISSGLNNVFSLNGQTVWASGPFASLLKSINGGDSWSQLSIPAAGGYRGIAFIDGSTGYVVGNGATRSTISGGSSWNTESTGTYGWVRAIQCIGPALCYIVGDDGFAARYGIPTPVTQPDNQQTPTTQPLRPDLNFSRSSLNCPIETIGLEFAEYSYEIIVRNGGETDAGSFTVRIEGIDAGGAVVGIPINRTIVGLAAGAATTLTGQIPVANVNPGADMVVRIRLTVDALNVISESDEDNNIGTMEQNCPAFNRAPVAPSLLAQRDNIDQPDQPTGYIDDDGLVAFKAFVNDPDGTSIYLDLEARVVGTAFTGIPTHTSLALTDGREVQWGLTIADGNYHWRLRAKDRYDAVSDWVSFGNNAETAVDFTISTTPNNTTAVSPNFSVLNQTPASDEQQSSNQNNQPVATDQGAGASSPSMPAANQSVSQTTTPATSSTSGVQSAPIESRQQQIERIQAEAPVVLLGVDQYVATTQVVRNTAIEQVADQKIAQIAQIELRSMSIQNQAQVQDAMKTFIAYGTNTTVVLGAGERAGVVNSFKEAFNKLPETQTDWEDVLKIANGRFPSQLNLDGEKDAGDVFERIYRRNPIIANPNDAAAVKIIAYGLRPTARNLNSERAAIRTFRSVYRTAPSSARDWDTVRAIAYSGASRQIPSEAPVILRTATEESTVSLGIGETWDAGFDYTITAQSIDVRATPHEVWLSLRRGGIQIDEAIVDEGQVYSYLDRQSSRGLTRFSARIDSIWSGASTDMVRLRDASISTAVTSCASVWRCDGWSTCINNSQRRSCYDENSCARPSMAPESTRSCSVGRDLEAGQTWEVVADYSITVQFIDVRARPRQVRLVLKEDGIQIDAAIVNEGQTYSYRETPGGSVTFSVRVDAIWAGASTDMVRLRDVMIGTSAISACAEDWRCTSWPACFNGHQIRSCSDNNACADFSTQPATTRSCIMLAE